MTVERGNKKGGVVGGKWKNKKSTTAEKNHLKKKQVPHNTLLNMVSNSRYTETAWPTWACARMPETADHLTNRFRMDLGAQGNHNLFVVNEVKLLDTTTL